MNTVLRETPTLASLPVSNRSKKRWLAASFFVLIASFAAPTYLVHLEAAEHLHQRRARELSLLYTISEAAGLEFGAPHDAFAAVRAFLSARSILAQHGIQIPNYSNEEAEAASNYLCMLNGQLQYSPTGQSNGT